MAEKYLAYPEYKNTDSEWVSEIPVHWEPILFKRVIIQIKDGTHGTHARVSEGFPFLSAKNVLHKGVEISDSESMVSEKDYKEITANGFPKKGDLLITCVGTIGRTCVYEFDKPYAFQRSVAFLRLSDLAEPKFYKYFVESKNYQSQLEANSKASAQSGVYMGDLVSTSTVLLPKDEQKSIANFLDHETAQIDTLIEKQQTLIQLLKEKRQAVISHAVTKGLNPDAPMKESGVEWLGEVPKHWEVGRYKFCTSRIVVGIAEAATHAYAETGVPILRSTNIKEEGLDISGMLFIKKEFAESNSSKYLYQNDIITVRTGYPGTSAVIPEALDKSQCFTNLIATPKDCMLSMFLSEYLNSHTGKAYFDLLGWGSAQKNISVPILQNIPIAWPDKIEQARIVSYLQQQRERYTKLVNEGEKQVELLKERRSALISAAVTGKIDVRGWQAPD